MQCCLFLTIINVKITVFLKFGGVNNNKIK